MAYTHNLAGVANQVGIEGCTSSSVNYQLVVGNGTSRSGTPLTSSNLAPGLTRGYRVEYFPADKTILTDGAGNQVIKSDIVPAVSAASDGDATLRIGLCTSTTTAKLLKLFACVLLGKIYDSNVSIGEWL
jgi:Tfp pilus assembly protein PilW